MKGLTLTQPWASLVALGEKAVETRSWPTSYRGDLVIHAAKGFPGDYQALCWREPFATPLIGGGFDRTEKLPRGAVVAVARLRDVIPTERIVSLWEHHGMSLLSDDPWPESRERAFGNYDPRRYAWLLEDVRAVPEAIPCKGALGLWSVPQIVLDGLARQGFA